MSNEPSDAYKRAVAVAAAELVRDGDCVGLGTGSTVAHLVPALAARGLSLRCTATSPQTEHMARELGLSVEPLDAFEELDIAIDGADEVDPQGWLIKGGGAAHTREKIVAAAARRFVVIVSSEKVVERLSPPVPVELLRFGAERTLATLEPVRLREGRESPDGGLLADCLCAVEDPARLAAWLAAVPGVVEHGLFGSQMVSDVLVANGDDVEHRALS